MSGGGQRGGANGYKWGISVYFLHKILPLGSEDQEHGDKIQSEKALEVQKEEESRLLQEAKTN